jgi:hypothetical protein
MEPPSFSIALRTASVRFCGFLTMAANASVLYAACNK